MLNKYIFGLPFGSDDSLSKYPGAVDVFAGYGDVHIGHRRDNLPGDTIITVYIVSLTNLSLSSKSFGSLTESIEQEMMFLYYFNISVDDEHIGVGLYVNGEETDGTKLDLTQAWIEIPIYPTEVAPPPI